MGNITDSSGNFTLLTLSLLPVTSHGIHEHGFNMNTNMNKQLLSTYEEPSLFNPHHFSFPTAPVDLLSLTNNQDMAYNNLLLNPSPSNSLSMNDPPTAPSADPTLVMNPSLSPMDQSTLLPEMPLTPDQPSDPILLHEKSINSCLVEPTAHPDENFNLQPPPLSMTLQAFSSIADKKFNIPSFPLKDNVDRSSTL